MRRYFTAGAPFNEMERFQHQDRYRIDFLAGGAGRCPHTQGIVGSLCLQNLGKDTLLYISHGLRESKEAGDIDQKVLGKGAGPDIIFTKELDILRERWHLLSRIRRLILLRMVEFL
jgi:hypothetical protein